MQELYKMPDTEFRITRLETEMFSVKADLKEIMGTHLPQIKVEIEQLRGEIKALSSAMKIYGAIIMIALTAIAGLVVSR